MRIIYPRFSSHRSQNGLTLIKYIKEIKFSWSEHYKNLINWNPIVHKDKVLSCLLRHNLDLSLDDIPSKEELLSAMKCLKNNKACGPGSIPAELFREGVFHFQKQLYQLITKLWQQEKVSSDFRDAFIVNIYKKKSDKAICENYRGISLLSTVSKILTPVANGRLRTMAEIVLPESQSGFCHLRRTIDMIFSVRQLQKEYRELYRTLYLAFTDLTKAFDSVHHGLLRCVLKAVGYPPRLFNIIRPIHYGVSASVIIGSIPLKPFYVTFDGKQGCSIASTLIVIFIAFIPH